jgi:hypothetical protein
VLLDRFTCQHKARFGWISAVAELCFPSNHVTHLIEQFRFVGDSDMPLAQRYQLVLQLIPPQSPPTQPLLTMQTDSGELIFDTRGDVTLRPSSMRSNQSMKPLSSLKRKAHHAPGTFRQGPLAAAGCRVLITLLVSVCCRYCVRPA